VTIITISITLYSLAICSCGKLTGPIEYCASTWSCVTVPVPHLKLTDAILYTAFVKYSVSTAVGFPLGVLFSFWRLSSRQMRTSGSVCTRLLRIERGGDKV
jgi:hypothetical protein